MEEQPQYRPCPPEPEIEGITFSKFKGGNEIAEIKEIDSIKKRLLEIW